MTFLHMLNAMKHSDPELPFLVAQLSLLSGDGKTSLDIACAPTAQSSPQRLLYGGLVSSTHIFRNLQGARGVYFLFPDVSVRWSGRFQIKVSLIALPKHESFAAWLDHALTICIQTRILRYRDDEQAGLGVGRNILASIRRSSPCALRCT